jgi:hypothetical protein
MNTEKLEKTTGLELTTKEVQQIYNSALTKLYEMAKQSKLPINNIGVQEAIKKEAKGIVESICPAINRILQRRKEN